MKLSDLHPAEGSTRRIKRIGRGIGSGHGKTAGRGHKGKGSRSGGNTPPGYEGGQMPLQRRLPKRGFRRLLVNERAREEFSCVNLRRLAIFEAGATVDPAVMAERGLVRAGKQVKVLGDGSVSAALTIRAHAFSKSAAEKIAAAGGTAEVIGSAAA
ncbi:MAG TPA: 50S ribosomal protein L15 [Candidatus Binataceae bacterium]|jgi:large subunit ribosomal protein L15|nr:50S ribosomal protein L15 [Candidatus Binataceae bacterium]